VKIEKLLKFCLSRLEKREIDFAICGGLAAQVYRDELRLTADIDFLLSKGKDRGELADEIIISTGLTPYHLKVAQLSPRAGMNKKRSPLAVVVGRDPADKNALGLDFLLPIMPWAPKALERAKNNIISFLGVSAPIITAEDVLLSKINVLSDGKERPKDIDDITSILRKNNQLDLAYLAAEIEIAHYTLLPHQEKLLPDALRIPIKRNRTRKIKS
jgi:hypothetical protein